LSWAKLKTAQPSAQATPRVALHIGWKFAKRVGIRQSHATRRSAPEEKQMLAFYRSATLEQLEQQAQQLRQQVEQEFLPLSAQQISWKPSAKDWSIGQCFEHASKTMALFFPIFQRILNGRYKLGIHRLTAFTSPLWAQIVLSSMSPPFNKITVPAVPQSWPSQTYYTNDIIREFSRTQNHYLDYFPLLNAANSLNLRILSPMSVIATYSVIDAIRITFLHNQHHVGQAQRVLAAQKQANTLK
jgi:hypothetical protein